MLKAWSPELSHSVVESETGKQTELVEPSHRTMSAVNLVSGPFSLSCSVLPCCMSHHTPPHPLRCGCYDALSYHTRAHNQ